MKEIWRKNFEIKKVDYQLLAESMESFYKFQKSTVGKSYLHEGIFVFENGDNSGSYFIKKELRNLIDGAFGAIIYNTERVKKVHKKTVLYNKRLFLECKKIEKLKLEKFSKVKLLTLYKNLFKWLQLAHGYSLPSTWFVDSDGEDLTNYLIRLVAKKIKESNIKISIPETFSILTTPSQESIGRKEEKETYSILKFILKDSVAKKLFSKNDVRDIENDLNKINKMLRNKIILHYKKFCWLPYTYVGPAHNLDYYLEIWSFLVRQKVNPTEELLKISNIKKKSKTRRIKLLKDLKLNKKEKEIFDLAAEIVWLKGFRKDISFYSYFVNDKILKELGKRVGFSLMQMKYIAPREMFKFNKFLADELNQRFRFSLIYGLNGKIKILIGEKAKKFLKEQKFEKVKIKKSDEIKGTCAFVGKAKGIVKIINLPEDMVKMKKGDIMIAHTTFPALVPAMKKAAVIVTEDGGITCHAAIVARELKIPCVVGTKIATQILKDGDLVEVDANKGVVKIININKDVKV